MSETPRSLQNFIGGAFAAAAEGETSEIVDPSSEESIGTAAVSTAPDVEAAVRAAAAARDGWARTTPGERALALLRLADAVERHGDELAALESADAGKPIAACRADEIPFVVDNLRFFAGAARCLEGKAAGEYVEGYTSMIRREPVGVVAQIAPWNYPLMMAVWKIAPALAAGCTTILKPAPATPVSTVRLAELAADLLPPGVLNVVLGGNEPGAELVRHPDVDMVSVTGAVETGIRVAAAAAESVKRTHLELGGKAPVVIFADSELEVAIATAAGAGYYNAGQDCTAATRVLAAAEVYDEVVEGLRAQAGAHVIGDTADERTTLGPLSSAVQRERVEAILERVPAHVEVVAGGARPDRPGFYLEPTVLTGLRQDDELIQHEVFGPVLTVQRFGDEAEAIAMANGTRFGLAASIWTRDVARALRVANAVRFGCVWINGHIAIASEMPHGGVKASGYGKDLSMYALEDYTVVKHVMTSLS